MNTVGLVGCCVVGFIIVWTGRGSYPHSTETMLASPGAMQGCCMQVLYYAVLLGIQIDRERGSRETTSSAVSPCSCATCCPRFKAEDTTYSSSVKLPRKKETARACPSLCKQKKKKYGTVVAVLMPAFVLRLRCAVVGAGCW